MNEEAWLTTVHGVTELDVTEATQFIITGSFVRQHWPRLSREKTLGFEKDFVIERGLTLGGMPWFGHISNSTIL